jgi:murein DD-endopeptidase MepM/ murein hydrolase activator NlpD
MRDLIVLNNLRPPFEVRPGQPLVLPAGGSSFAGDVKAPQPAPLEPVERGNIAPIEPAPVSEQSLAPLPPPSSSYGSGAQALSASGMGKAPPAQALASAPSTTQTEPVPALNRPTPPQKQMATTANSTSSSGTSIDMQWPVQGPILSGFGPKGPGLNNDGVNIGAPKGAPVVAAAPGTVVYAGDEMKGFGNLVLIRHEGDWVTAYAHLDRVMVKKDSVVAQGDEIGTVGKTGNVSTPQLHFETRQSGKPVDPAGVVKGNP